jgi:hypothetical protein
MYEDRLDGRIDVSLFQRKSAEYRDQQSEILAEIERYGAADGQYVEAGITLLELTRNMHRLFEKQEAAATLGINAYQNNNILQPYGDSLHADAYDDFLTLNGGNVDGGIRNSDISRAGILRRPSTARPMTIRRAMS